MNGWADGRASQENNYNRPALSIRRVCTCLRVYVCVCVYVYVFVCVYIMYVFVRSQRRRRGAVRVIYESITRRRCGLCWAGLGGNMLLGGGVQSGGHRTRMAAVESIIETRSQFDRTEIVMTRTKINNRHRKNKTSPLSLHYNIQQCIIL